jgi:hypothetical protein
VFELDSVRGNETQTAVLKINSMPAWWNAQRPPGIVSQRHWFFVQQHLLHHHWGRKQICAYVCGVHRHQAPAGGKPEPPISGFAPGCLQTAGAPECGHSVTQAVGPKLHVISRSVRASIQFRLGDPDKAIVRTHPKEPHPIVFDVSDE